jgi:hypothetical protein
MMPITEPSISTTGNALMCRDTSSLAATLIADDPDEPVVGYDQQMMEVLCVQQLASLGGRRVGRHAHGIRAHPGTNCHGDSAM